MKRWISLLLALLMPLSCAFCEDAVQIVMIEEPPVEEALEEASDPDEVYAVSDAGSAAEETVIDPGELPEYVHWLLEIASAEIGYTEGPNNYSKYGEWAGDANAAWCAEFVCWCVNQVDEAHGTSLLRSSYPFWGGQNTGRDWFIKRGRFVYRKGNCPDWGYQWLRGDDHYLTKNEYVPRPGDLLFFSYNEAGDTAHVAIVEYCAKAADGEVLIHVIEGNNPSCVQRNTYKLNNSQVLGFGLPENRVDTVMRLGNKGDKVLWLQQMLHDLGMLEEIHMTGGFGSHTKQAVISFQKNQLGRTDANGLTDRETLQAIEEMWLIEQDANPDNWLVE